MKTRIKAPGEPLSGFHANRRAKMAWYWWVLIILFVLWVFRTM